MNNFRRHLILLGALGVLSSIAFLLSLVPMPVGITPRNTPEPPLSELIRDGQAPRPRFSTSTQEKLAKSHDASALLSYTDTGFEPREVTIKQGDTVRFTNNSAHDIWIAAIAGPGDRLYPSIPNGCGPSELDSCEVIHPQDFWEFTFEEIGTWRVVNALDRSRTAIIHVQ